MTLRFATAFAALVLMFPSGALVAQDQAAAANPDDPAKLKERIAALEKENGELKLKVTGLELEKIGASLQVDTPKEGPPIASVNLLKAWKADAATLDQIKGLPNLRVVYVDNQGFTDDFAAKIKEIPALSALTLMSKAVTDKSLEQIKGIAGLEMLFLTDTKVGDAGLAHLADLKNLKELSLSRTDVTDAGLDALKNVEKLSTLYLIGTKVTDEGLAKFKEAKPNTRVVK